VRGRALLAIGLGVVFCTACAAPHRPAAIDMKPLARPALDTDEAGLWMAMDRAEGTLKRSGHVMTDAALTGYVRGVICKLASAHCGDVRVYVVRTPQFNATMAPNGVMQVWTGLLLRTENEAQLAFVLGHEVGHYLRRHSVERWRDARLKGDVLAFFSLGAAAAGIGFVTPVVQLATLASIYAFSRDNEREADEMGFELMVHAGYDPREAARIWEALVKERDAGDDKQPLLFFSTHPSPDERIATLRALADKASVAGQPAVVGRDEFLAATLSHRATLLRDELRRRDFKRTAVLLDRLVDAGDAPGTTHYFRAEMYRLRADDGDSEKAIASYEQALATGAAPIDAHRSLGLVFMKQGEKARARAAFVEYLTRRPGADDREMIEAYLRRLE
jgi:Zn-dependent protease with chaperone function